MLNQSLSNFCQFSNWDAVRGIWRTFQLYGKQDAKLHWRNQTKCMILFDRFQFVSPEYVHNLSNKVVFHFNKWALRGPKVGIPVFILDKWWTSKYPDWVPLADWEVSQYVHFFLKTASPLFVYLQLRCGRRFRSQEGEGVTFDHPLESRDVFISSFSDFFIGYVIVKPTDGGTVWQKGFGLLN